MLNPRLKERLSQGYAKLADITYDIALNLRKGKDYTHKQQDLWKTGILMRLYLSHLFEVVAFQESGNPVVVGATESEVNVWVDVVVELGELDKYPIVPTIFPSSKPYIVNKGVKGDTGDAGTNGSDANIVVAPDTGETELSVREEVIGGVKHYFLSFSATNNPGLVIAIQGATIFEIGTVQDYNLAMTITKGKNNITAVTMIEPSALDSTLQPLVNLTGLNDLSIPDLIVLPIEDAIETTDYHVRVSDGTVNVDKIVTVQFVYPFLYGNNDLTSFDRYTLAKLLQPKGTQQFTFNAVDDYFYICYPNDYGNLQSIKDQNGFDVTSDWQVADESVTSNSLPSNWTKTYRVYRTINKTTINNRIFTITFP